MSSCTAEIAARRYPLERKRQCSIQTEMGSPYPGGTTAGSGYVTEKLYMLLQIYLQNKGWNHSVDLLPLFSELKDASMLPSASYLQMMASRIALDSQGRLILRENGKIILPFEHFANAVMLKHINGPHGLHLGLEATLRAVMDSYTIGRENYGMEKEFIMEVVNNCPNPACRYYKTQLDLTHNKPTYLPEPPVPQSTSGSSGSGISMGATAINSAANIIASSSGSSSLGGSGGGGGLCGSGLGGSGGGGLGSSGVGSMASSSHLASSLSDPSGPSGGASDLTLESKPPTTISSLSSGIGPPPQLLPATPSSSSSSSSSSATPSSRQQQQHKLTEFLKSNLENLESITSANKDLLAVHNGTWMQSDAPDGKHHVATSTEVGQEKIVRAFSEIMKNMNRMKSCVRPAMCKPYGKQSESLQKTLMDTIQLVQSLRSFLPPPHIAVSSWKNEDKHRKGVAGLEDLCDTVRKVE